MQKPFSESARPTKFNLQPPSLRRGTGESECQRERGLGEARSAPNLESGVLNSTSGVFLPPEIPTFSSRRAKFWPISEFDTVTFRSSSTRLYVSGCL